MCEVTFYKHKNYYSYYAYCFTHQNFQHVKEYYDDCILKRSYEYEQLSSSEFPKCLCGEQLNMVLKKENISIDENKLRCKTHFLEIETPHNFECVLNLENQENNNTKEWFRICPICNHSHQHDCQLDMCFGCSFTKYTTFNSSKLVNIYDSFTSYINELRQKYKTLYELGIILKQKDDLHNTDDIDDRFPKGIENAITIKEAFPDWDMKFKDFEFCNYVDK